MYEPKNYKIVIVASRMPPHYSGAGFSAYKHANLLLKGSKLGFILTHKFRETPENKNNRIDVIPIEPEYVKHIPSGDGTLKKLGKKMYLNFVFLIWYNIVFFVLSGYHLIKGRKKFDIVHCYSIGGLSFYSMLWAKVLGKKIITEVTLLGSDDPAAVLKSQGKFSKEYLSFVLSDRINCVSKVLINSCFEAGIPERKVSLITRSVDTSRFYPLNDSDKIKLKEKLFGDSNKKVCIFVGALIKRKGIDIAWESFKYIYTTEPLNDLLFFIIGDTGKSESRSALLKIINESKELNLEKKVRYIGTIGDIERYMQASDFLIFPSRSEGSPNVLKEAMACGVVVISNNINGITNNIIEDNHNGVLINNGNYISYAEKLIDLCSDLRLCSCLSANAVKTISGRFSSGIIEEQYGNVYQKLLTGKES